VSPRWRVRAAWALLVACVVGAVVSPFTWARSEPVTVLLLSWAALVMTAIDIIQTTDVRSTQEKQEERPPC
jgi:hypothetical protein